MTERLFPCRSIELDEFDSLAVVLKVSREFSLTPSQLFDSFEREQDWIDWVPILKDVTWTSPKPYQIGTTRTVYLAGGVEGLEEFIAWEPGRRMAFRFTDSNRSFLRALGEDYTVTATERGCRLDWTMSIDMKAPLGWFLWLLQPIIRSNLRRYLGDLEQILRKRYV